MASYPAVAKPPLNRKVGGGNGKGDHEAGDANGAPVGELEESERVVVDGDDEGLRGVGRTPAGEQVDDGKAPEREDRCQQGHQSQGRTDAGERDVAEAG